MYTKVKFRPIWNFLWINKEIIWMNLCILSIFSNPNKDFQKSPTSIFTFHLYHDFALSTPLPSFLRQNLQIYRLDSPFAPTSSLRSSSRHSRKNATRFPLLLPFNIFHGSHTHSLALLSFEYLQRISSIIKLHIQPRFTTNSSLSLLVQDKFVLAVKTAAGQSTVFKQALARRAFLSSSFMGERGRGKLHVDVHPATIIPLSACKLWGPFNQLDPFTPSPVTYARQRVIILVICLTELCKIARNFGTPCWTGNVTCEHSNFVLRYKYSYALKSAE